MPKSILSWLVLPLLLIGCVSKQNPVSSGDHMHGTSSPKGICADAKAPPLSQCSPTVTATFDAQGKLWIVWVNHDQLYVQSSSDKGQHFSSPMLVNQKPEDIAAKDESRPKIKVDAHGHIYLTWVLTLDKKRSTYVRFSQSSDGGQHFSRPVTVNDNLQIIRHRFDSLEIGQNGEIFVAWLDARETEAVKKSGQEFKGLSLYYSWSDDGGQHFHPNQKIAEHTCECCRLGTAINQANQPVLAWRHIFAGDIRDHAIVTFSNWQSPGEIIHLGQENWKIDACPHHGPGLAIAANNRYHAVWFSNSNTKQGLFYAYSNNAGKSFSEPLNFGTAGANHPHVMAVGERVGIVWQAFDGRENVLHFIQSSDEGRTWSAPLIVAKSAEKIDEPFLLTDDQQLYLSWHTPQAAYRLQAIKP